MKVKELIERLGHFDADAEVIFPGDEYDIFGRDVDEIYEGTREVGIMTSSPRTEKVVWLM